VDVVFAADPLMKKEINGDLRWGISSGRFVLCILKPIEHKYGAIHPVMKSVIPTVKKLIYTSGIR
jgi:hypothetical protein